MNDKNPRDLSKVTCFKCQQKGHIATNCTVKDEETKNTEIATGPVTRSKAAAAALSLNSRRVRIANQSVASVETY